MSREIEKYLNWVSIGALFAVLFVPLIISTSLFFPFITGKAFAFRILTEIAFGAWAILAISFKKYRPSKNPLSIAIAVFILIMLVANIAGENFMRSFWSNFERSEGFVTLLHLSLFFTVLTSMFKTKEIWHKFLNTSLVVSLIVGGRGFLQLFGLFISTQSGSRLDSFFGNAAYLAVYMLFNIFITLYLLSKYWSNKTWRFIYLFIALFNSFILVFSATRGAILGLFGGLLLSVLIIAWFERENRTLRKYSFRTLIALVILVIGFLALRNTPIIQKVEPLRRIAEISLQDKTTQSRFMVWGIALEGFKEKPILGWGQENYTFVFDKYYNPEMYAQEPWFDRAHNVFFDWLIAGGILGLLSYLSIFIFTLWIIWKRTDFSVLETGLFTGLLAGYFFQNLFVFDNIGSYILFFSILGFISFKGREKDTDSLIEEDSSRKEVSPIALPLVGIATVIVIYFVNIPAIFAGSTLIDALTPQNGDVSKNLGYYKEALTYTDFGDMEIREQLLNATGIVRNAQNISPDLKNQFINLSIEEMNKQTEENPRSLRNNLFFATFLDQVGLYDEAIKFLDKSKEISPSKQSVYFEYVNHYLSRREFEKALESAKTAFELAPKYENARIIYAIALVYNKRTDDAKALINEEFGTPYRSDLRLARAYFENGYFIDSINVWKVLIEREPQNINYRLSLAATYIEIGERGQAITILEEAKSINPSLTEQIDFYINEIKAGRNP